MCFHLISNIPIVLPVTPCSYTVSHGLFDRFPESVKQINIFFKLNGDIQGMWSNQFHLETKKVNIFCKCFVLIVLQCYQIIVAWQKRFERDHKPKIDSWNFISKYSLILPRKTKETRNGSTNLKGLVKNIRSMEKGQNTV